MQGGGTKKKKTYAYQNGPLPNGLIVQLKAVFLQIKRSYSKLQRVPINIVHGEINDFLKCRSDQRIKFYSNFKPMVLFIIGEKIKKIHRRKPEISLIR